MIPMRDVYEDTGQARGGQGVVHIHSLIILEKQVHEATGCLGEGIGESLLCQLAYGRSFKYGQNSGQLDYQPTCVLAKLIRGFFVQCHWNFYMQDQRPRGDFGLCEYVHVPCMSLVARKVELPTFDNLACDFDTEPICDEYDEDYMLVHLSRNHIPQEFSPSKTLDMVLFHKQ